MALGLHAAHVFYNRGNALKDLGRQNEAIASYDKAIALKPDYTSAISNRGNALMDLKRIEEAIASYEQALAFDPGFVGALRNRAMIRLLTGELRDGWADYEQRWRDKDFPGKRPALNAPEWRGGQPAR